MIKPWDVMNDRYKGWDPNNRYREGGYYRDGGYREGGLMAAGMAAGHGRLPRIDPLPNKTMRPVPGMPSRPSPILDSGGGLMAAGMAAGHGRLPRIDPLPNKTMRPVPGMPSRPSPILDSGGGLMAAGMAAGHGMMGATSTGYTPSLMTPGTSPGSTWDPATGSASAYDPTKINPTGSTWTPDPQTVHGNELTSHQLAWLTGGNNPYIQQARQRGRMQAARAGMLTGSVAAGASERAAIGAALPIAQADAGWYGSVAARNMDAANAARHFNADQTLQIHAADAGAATNANQYNTGARNAMTARNMDAANAARNFNASIANASSQFNAEAANRAGEANARAADSASQFNAGQYNRYEQSQRELAEKQAEYGRTLHAQQANSFFGSAFTREQSMAATLQSIFENANLNPSQQRLAADHARDTMQELWKATDETFKNGIPDIFLDYDYDAGLMGALARGRS